MQHGSGMLNGPGLGHGRNRQMEDICMKKKVCSKERRQQVRQDIIVKGQWKKHHSSEREDSVLLGENRKVGPTFKLVYMLGKCLAFDPMECEGKYICLISSFLNQ